MHINIHAKCPLYMTYFLTFSDFRKIFKYHISKTPLYMSQEIFFTILGTPLLRSGGFQSSKIVFSLRFGGNWILSSPNSQDLGGGIFGIHKQIIFLASLKELLLNSSYFFQKVNIFRLFCMRGNLLSHIVLRNIHHGFTCNSILSKMCKKIGKVRRRWKKYIETWSTLC